MAADGNSPTREEPAFSRQDRGDHVGFLDAREAVFEALELERQPLVIDSEAVQDRGMEISDVNGITNAVVPELVGFSERESATNTPPGQEHGKGSAMMIPAVGGV